MGDDGGKTRERRLGREDGEGRWADDGGKTRE